MQEFLDKKCIRMQHNGKFLNFDWKFVSHISNNELSMVLANYSAIVETTNITEENVKAHFYIVAFYISTFPRKIE